MYVFRRGPQGWTYEHEFLSFEVVSGGSGFGYGIAVFDDTAMVGAPSETAGGFPVAGQVHVYRRSPQGIWSETQVLTARDVTQDTAFGWSIDICGDWALIADPGHDGATVESGAAYIFHYDGTTWVEKQQLVAADTSRKGGGDLFGYSVSLSQSDHGMVAIIGAYKDDDSGPDDGSAYIFRYDAGKDFWHQEQELLLATGPGGQFGRAVAIDGDWAVIGAYTSWLAAPQHGAAFVYHYDGQRWNLADTLLPDTGGGTLPLYSWSVSLSGNTAIVSAHGEFSQSGAVYIYNIDPVFADLDCDNHVNGLDLMILLGSWGPLPRRTDADPAADLDGNGTVNGFDLALLLGAWG